MRVASAKYLLHLVFCACVCALSKKEIIFKLNVNRKHLKSKRLRLIERSRAAPMQNELATIAETLQLQETRNRVHREPW